ncbi:mechanosensitive ion channel family protein [Haloarchaeobius baliensis]|uniref:mechanosensitive ion channel family protein n=1 Tax=Haloarchaeobius baliensis TaxID=1670458 RepID=UPI003F880F69
MIPTRLPLQITPDAIVRWLDNVFSRIVTDFQGIAPNLLYALIYLVVGFLAAMLVSRTVVRVTRRMGLDELAEDSPIGEFLPGRDLSRLLGQFASLYIYLLVGLLVMEELGIGRVAAAFNGAVEFLPTAIIAVLVVVLGFWLADLVEDRMSDSELGDGQVGALFGAAVQVFVYLIAIAVGFGALASSTGAGGIAFPIIQAFALGFAIALGLAVGWVSKDHLAGAVDGDTDQDDADE